MSGIRLSVLRVVMGLIAGLVAGVSFASAASTQPYQEYFTRFYPSHAKALFQIGAFSATQGNAQNVGIDGLIGDHFSVNDNTGHNVLLGLGYYANGFTAYNMDWMFGLNGFYFGHTSVNGYVTQEQMFTNLSYHYTITNYPLYFATRAYLHSGDERYNFTVDLGIGPDFIRTDNFSESSIDGGVTLPDRAYSGRTTVAFSATFGIGVKINNVVGHYPLEIGYKFFYLGEGKFNNLSNQFYNNLNTGNNYANALVFTISD